ncbi:putative Ig domain-containing protein, partial [Novipirellula rosea]|uniref:putative Ig domain-containing protein n=1 Tax=Novipirellula rosea TaxID=1031540 RepID=UPI0031E9806F
VGASIDSGTGAFTWTPSEADGPGVYTFDVTVNDGTATTSQTITVTVLEANVAPVLDVSAAPTAAVDEGTAISFTATATDADAPAQTLTFSLSGSVPAGATIDPASGVFSWTPSEAQGPGSYTFNVVVSDGTLSDVEAITITVDEVNVAPVLNPVGNKSATEGTLLSFTASATDADLPANTLTFSLANGTGGSVPAGASIDPTTGVFTWTP